MIKNIYFIYPRAHKNTGSTVMRAFQAAEILRSTAEHHRLTIHTKPITNLRTDIAWYVWLKTIKRHSLVVFCKDAIDRLPRQLISWLKNNDIKVAVDYVDKSLNGFDFYGIDIHIASSSKQAAFLKSLAIENLKVYELFHLGDLRLYEKNQKNNRSRGIVYYGELQNTYIPENLLKHIEIMPYNGRVSDADLEKLRLYKFLYCVRDPRQNRGISVFKPTTKIMNAIALLIPPIVTSDMDGVIDILGSSYPFMTRTTSDKDIERVLDLASSDEQAYTKAVDILRKCQARYNPSAWRKAFIDMLET